MKASKTIAFQIFSILRKIIFLVFSIAAIFIMTMVVFVLISAIQEKFFLPQSYTMWLSKYPFSRLPLIYEIYILFGFLYLFNKQVRKAIGEWIHLKANGRKRFKSVFLVPFIVLNILLIYAILYNVTVITNNQIINYTCFSPQGKAYTYSDIVQIDAGIYGQSRTLNPYPHYTKGDFYYSIQLKDGTILHLTDVGGTRDDEDERLILEKLDRQYVNMGIPKTSSMANFEYSTQHLDKIYTDRIKTILLNTK